MPLTVAATDSNVGSMGTTELENLNKTSIQVGFVFRAIRIYIRVCQIRVCRYIACVRYACQIFSFQDFLKCVTIPQHLGDPCQDARMVTQPKSLFFPQQFFRQVFFNLNISRVLDTRVRYFRFLIYTPKAILKKILACHMT